VRGLSASLNECGGRRGEKPRRCDTPPLASQSENSASPADAWNLPARQPALRPDGRSRRATIAGCRKSRASHLYRSLHREGSVSSRRGHGRYGHGAYGGRRYRWHFSRIPDAARIVDRAVESARIRRSGRNAAHAGILGRRSCGSGHKTQDRNAHECRSGDWPSAREDRNKLRALHQPVLLRTSDPRGRTWKQQPKFQWRAIGQLRYGALVKEDSHPPLTLICCFHHLITRLGSSPV
jgi:hypothetical protein